jgi:hypothetical protein
MEERDNTDRYFDREWERASNVKLVVDLHLVRCCEEEVEEAEEDSGSGVGLAECAWAWA